MFYAEIIARFYNVKPKDVLRTTKHQKTIILHLNLKTVQLLNMKTTRRGGDKSTYEIIINAYPKEVIVHNNPLDNRFQEPYPEKVIM